MINKNISPKQSKIARAYLNWSQEELAEKVRVVKKTIADFEREARTPYNRTLEDLKEVFKQNGIEFLENEEELMIRITKNINSKKQS